MRAILSVFAILAATASAQAHSPDFTRAEKIALPDGNARRNLLAAAWRRGDPCDSGSRHNPRCAKSTAGALARAGIATGNGLPAGCSISTGCSFMCQSPAPSGVEPALDLPNQDLQLRGDQRSRLRHATHAVRSEVASGYAAYLSSTRPAATLGGSDERARGAVRIVCLSLRAEPDLGGCDAASFSDCHAGLAGRAAIRCPERPHASVGGHADLARLALSSRARSPRDFCSMR